MTGIVIALLGGGLLGAAGAVWALVERVKAANARAEVVGLRGQLVRAMDAAEAAANALKAEREVAAETLRGERVTRIDERNRLEAVIVQLKAGVAQLEEDLDACDGAAVRDRLRKLLLLGGQAPAAGAAAAPALDGLRGVLAPALGTLGRSDRR